MKNHRKGQAACWNSNVIKKMRGRLISPQQRLIFEISLYTGERIGAITQLKVRDCYGPTGKVLDTITFASNTRKATKHGTADTRQVPIHVDLMFYLERFFPGSDDYLFPGRGESGHITVNAVDKYWRKIFADFGLTGFSTHSSRRWVINSLRQNGIEITTIAETMGMNIATVRHYLDNDPIECKRAIATLAV
jgi:integrase/recombinase XerD